MFQANSQQLVDLSPLPICVIRNEKISYANYQMELFIGFSLKDLLEKPVNELIHTSDWWIIEKCLHELIFDGTKQRQCEFRIENKDKQILRVKAHFYLIGDNGQADVACQIIDSGSAAGIFEPGENKYRELFNLLSYGVAIYEGLNGGNDFIVRDFNRAAERIDGIDKEELLNKSVLEVFSGIKQQGLFDVFQRVWKTGRAEHYPVFIYTDQRTAGWRNNYIYKLPSGEIVSVYDDITGLKQAEEALKESEKRFRKIFQQSPIGIEVYDSKGLMVNMNKACMEIFGLTDMSLAIGCDLFRNPYLPEAAKQKLLNGETVSYTAEIDFCQVNKTNRFKTNKTGICYLDYSITPLITNGQARYGYLVQIQDITARKQAEKKIRYLSLHDCLTGCFNRAYFEQELKRIEKGRHSSVCIIVFDIDGLKLINDTLGHTAGDQLLIAAAAILKDVFRADDVVARIGGDEFAVILPDSGRSVVDGFCCRVTTAINRHNVKKPQLPLSMSMGVGVTELPGKALDQLFREADDELYREKLSRRQNAQNLIVQTLIKASDFRSFFAEGHMLCLSKMVEDLAAVVSLGKRETNDLRILAQFHDIGKVGVLESLLLKKGKLAHDEIQEIHRHCEIGYRIAMAAPGLISIAGLILKHHEWWNGEGYPLGLKGEEIPLECRIFAIAEAFDAMTNDRPYRKAMSYQDAVNELVRCSGTQFDPGLVPLFVELLEKTVPEKS